MMGLPGGSNGGVPLGTVAMAIGLAIAFAVMYGLFRMLCAAADMI